MIFNSSMHYQLNYIVCEEKYITVSLAIIAPLLALYRYFVIVGSSLAQHQ